MTKCCKGELCVKFCGDKVGGVWSSSHFTCMELLIYEKEECPGRTVEASSIYSSRSSSSMADLMSSSSSSSCSNLSRSASPWTISSNVFGIGSLSSSLISFGLVLLLDSSPELGIGEPLFSSNAEATGDVGVSNVRRFGNSLPSALFPFVEHI